MEEKINGKGIQRSPLTRKSGSRGNWWERGIVEGLIGGEAKKEKRVLVDVRQRQTCWNPLRRRKRGLTVGVRGDKEKTTEREHGVIQREGMPLTVGRFRTRLPLAKPTGAGREKCRATGSCGRKTKRRERGGGGGGKIWGGSQLKQKLTAASNSRNLQEDRGWEGTTSSADKGGRRKRKGRETSRSRVGAAEKKKDRNLSLDFDGPLTRGGGDA